MWNKQGTVAPKRAGDFPLLFQNLSSYNINNQWTKFDKNPSAGSIPVE